MSKRRAEKMNSSPEKKQKVGPDINRPDPLVLKCKDGKVYAHRVTMIEESYNYKHVFGK